MKLINQIHIGKNKTALYYPHYVRERFVKIVPDEETFYRAVFGRLIKLLKEETEIKIVEVEYLLPLLYSEKDRLGIEFKLGKFEEILKDSPVTKFTFETFPNYFSLRLKLKTDYSTDRILLSAVKQSGLFQKLKFLLSAFFDLNYRSQHSIACLYDNLEYILNRPNELFINVLRTLDRKVMFKEVFKDNSETLHDNFIFYVNCKDNPKKLPYNSDRLLFNPVSITVPSLCMVIQMNNEYEEEDLKVDVGDYVELVLNEFPEEFKQLFEKSLIDTLYQAVIKYNDALPLLLMPKRIVKEVLGLVNKTKRKSPIKNLARVLEKFNFEWEGKIGELASKEIANCI